MLEKCQHIFFRLNILMNIGVKISIALTNSKSYSKWGFGGYKIFEKATIFICLKTSSLKLSFLIIILVLGELLEEYQLDQ